MIPPDVMEIYAAYRREVYVGRSPALLAIDLYNLVYQGGAKQVNELIDRYPSACGVFAYAAIEPTKRLFAAARSHGLPVIYTTAATGRRQRRRHQPAGRHRVGRRLRDIRGVRAAPGRFADREGKG